MAGEYHRLPLQWQGRRPGARPVNVGSREGSSELPTTTSAHR